MKFFLISDNTDTLLGMRIAGVEGIVAHTAAEVNEALNGAVADEDIAVVLMTQKTAALCPERVYDIKLNYRRPLVIEIPDRHGSGGVTEAIGRYVEEAIGVKL